MNYKTPGVYVEEVSVFPPSVAEVETAVPAFIGHTEYAESKGKGLSGQAVEVSSLVEFEERFGGAPPVKVKEIVLTETNNVSKLETESTYYMYDSIRLYFANGGGRCYIVSVGDYDTEISLTPLSNGLAAIAIEDEPTMLLFPDAVKLSADNLATLQQAALLQAKTLGDRVAILDVKETGSWKSDYQAFRSKVGINNLPYGAAYTPYLKASLPKAVKFSQVYDKLVKYGAGVKLVSLTDEDEVKTTINTLTDIVLDKAELARVIGLLLVDTETLTEEYNAKVNELKDTVNEASSTDATLRAALKALYSFCYSVLDTVFDDLTADTTTLVGTGSESVLAAVTSKLTAVADTVAEKLNAYTQDANTPLGGVPTAPAALTEMYNKEFTWTSTLWGEDRFDTTKVTADNSIYGGTTVAAKVSAAEPVISGLFKQLVGAIADVKVGAVALEKAKEDLLTQQMPTYKNIVKAVSSELTILPPSGAIAGIYCMVDRTRGVWKAPANVSLNNVSGVTVRIDNVEQDDLNVDVNAGKSINAIRPFAGKGVLVWGARTLAGNDNEWRYVPVRRFFNMVEESVQKSTAWAVFEPNDANLWTKVKAMIENYLMLKWREGALAGAKPEDAFFVHVGLGTTMTPQDILEGRLIVEIGMAAVRPAEFIILRFMHKLQES